MKLNKVVFLIIAVAMLCFHGCDKELSVSQPEPTPPRGKLTIKSNPDNYSIHLDNRIMGRWTPDSFSYLNSGTYEIELRDSIFLDTLLLVTIDTNEVKSIYLDMTTRDEFYGAVQINSSENNVEVILNDSATGLYTPTMIDGLYPGVYNIDFYKKGFRSFEETIIVKSNETSNCYGVLVDTTIWLAYTAEDCEMSTSSLSCIGNNLNISNELWIGTADNGLIKYNDGNFKNYNSLNASLPALYITDVFMNDDATVYAGSYFGLAFYDGISWREIEYEGESVTGINNIFYDASWEIGTGYQKKYYLCCHQNGILLYNNGTFREYDPYPGGMPSNNIFDMKKHDNGRMVIVSTDKGVFMNEYNNHDVWHSYDYTNTPFWDNKGETKISALGIKEYSDEVYVGNNFGNFAGQLFYFSESKTDSQWIEIGLNGYPKVFSILIKSSSVWVGTSNGLYKLGSDSQIKEYYNSENSPLISNFIYDLTIDRSGDLWMATGNGLVRFKQ